MPRKINVKGSSGAGKSTFAAEVARRLALPCIELDALHWGPNWSEPTSEDFRARVQEAMVAAPGGWVIDGNYDRKLGDLVIGAADTLVWLDLPLQIKLRRLWRRTIHRMRNDVELWNGNRESWRAAFVGRESLFVWMIRAHVRHRRQWSAQFGRDPRFVRLRTVAEARRWLDEVIEGQCCHEAETPETAAWVERQLARLAAGQAATLAAEWQTLPCRGEARTIRDAQVTYFANQASRMAYDRYQAAGWDIGSGMIESAYEAVIGMREKGPGMRWTEARARAVINVRRLLFNHEWETHWAAA